MAFRRGIAHGERMPRSWYRRLGAGVSLLLFVSACGWLVADPQAGPAWIVIIAALGLGAASLDTSGSPHRRRPAAQQVDPPANSRVPRASTRPERETVSR
jgi:hypothetical protein